MVTTTIATETEAADRTASRGAAPSLRCPEPDDAWRVAPVAHAPAPPPEARLGSGEHLLVEPEAGGRGTLLTGMIAAICIVAAVLGGMAVLSYGNGPASTQSASAPTR
jgi:hypothetical protein